MLDFNRIIHAEVKYSPYPHLLATDTLPFDYAPLIHQDFPNISTTGFLPLTTLSRVGLFDQLMTDLESPQFAKILGIHFGLELGDKPRLITVRRWSGKKDGRIHNDSEAKLATALLYLNEKWDQNQDEGQLRVLHNKQDFDNVAMEVTPLFGSFFAFARTNNSWHGHKPFIGERKVIQVAFLRSQEDYLRKEKRGNLSSRLKRIFQKNSSIK